MKTKEIRSVFISDLHIGSEYCQIDLLLDFINEIKNDVEYLYLAGDIVDGWKLKKKWYWCEGYTKFFRKILKLSENGVKIIWITGNHDEFLRAFVPHTIGNIQIFNECIHETIDGKKLLVVHGDFADTLTKHFKIMYYIGDTGYTFAMWLNKWFNFFRRKMGFSYWSLSAMLKKSVKQAVNYINSFEHFIVKYTKEKGCSGVIVGHIHHPCIKKIDNVDYYNAGGWQEECTAIIEYKNGTMELIFWKQK